MDDYLVFGVVGGIIAALVLLLFLLRRRSEAGLEIETIAPTDVLSDDIIREIILLVGNAGDKGIRQSRISNILKRPKSTISRKIRKLNNEGYVHVTRAGKTNIIRLTDKGLDLYKKIVEASGS